MKDRLVVAVPSLSLFFFLSSLCGHRVASLPHNITQTPVSSGSTQSLPGLHHGVWTPDLLGITGRQLQEEDDEGACRVGEEGDAPLALHPQASFIINPHLNASCSRGSQPGTVAFLGKKVLGGWWVCPVHHTMVSSIPALAC